MEYGRSFSSISRSRDYLATYVLGVYLRQVPNIARTRPANLSLRFAYFVLNRSAPLALPIA